MLIVVCFNVLKVYFVDDFRFYAMNITRYKTEWNQSFRNYL